MGLGGADAVYIEDCTFLFESWKASAPTTDCEGGNFVFRYNSATNVYLEMHDAIIVNLRGCRKWEIYENEFIVTDSDAQYWGLHLRSGTGVVFNNTWNGKPGADPIAIALYRTYQTGGDPWDGLCSDSSGKACLGTDGTYSRQCSSDADCGGSVGSCVDIDGSSESPSGYPCRDQIGRGEGNPQESVPALFWNNKYCNTYPCTPTTYAGINKVSGGLYYIADRDYCVNLDSDMPTTCNGETVSYTPYTYPHPLRQAGVGIKPQPPQDLRLIN